MKVLDYLNLGYIRVKSYPSLRRIWSAADRDFGKIRINYGFERVPGPDEHVFGGLVKLQDLNRVFPQTPYKPNILYLVSSALPYFPVRLVKMARKSGAKIVLNQNGVAYPGWYGEGYQKENRSMAYVHSVADYVFYQSRFCKISAEKYLGELSPEQCSEILYNPVDTETFYPRKDKTSKDRTTILLSGSHWTTYRVYTAIEALKIILCSRADVTLRIAGRFCWHADTKKAEKEVFAYAKQAGVENHVHYIGSYSQEAAPALMNDCSILMHTKYNDPCPRLVVEAMACGLPVVYSASGGVTELVGEHAGIGVTAPLDWLRDHPPKPEELAQCVLQVINKLPEFSQKAREQAANHFNVNTWISRHKKVFDKLVMAD